ncbi:MAG: C39 family peptidase [Candidatus Moraniibacteriota bacterium]
MSYKKIFIIVFAAALISFGIYYRDYIPTTRADFVNLYYFITHTAIPTPVSEHGASSAEWNGGISLEKNISNQNTSTTSDNSSLEGSLPDRQAGPDVAPSSADASAGKQDDNNTNNNTQDNNVNPNISQDTSVKIPDSINNYVPFTSQAPFANWDKLHEEACEEASLAMAHYYLDKRDVVFSKEAEKDIQYIASKTKGGGLVDLTVEEVSAAAADLYGYKNWKIVEKPTAQDIKKELSLGNIIIIPLAGRGIGNPYYKQPGPLYHMLVISGYDNKKGVFITQDPGTKRGKDFPYKFNTLLKANHNSVGDENKIDQGPARILVVVK